MYIKNSINLIYKTYIFVITRDMWSMTQKNNIYIVHQKAQIKLLPLRIHNMKTT